MRFNNRAFTDAQQLTALVAADNNTSGFIKDVEGFRAIGSTTPGVAVSHTGSTSEVALASIVVPTLALGPNGIIEGTALFAMTNSANNKTVRVRFGNGLSGTAFVTNVLTTSAATRVWFTIHNSNANNIQIGGLANGGFGGTASANVAGAIDTTAEQTLTISGQLASAGETITLASYIARLKYGA